MAAETDTCAVGTEAGDMNHFNSEKDRVAPLNLDFEQDRNGASPSPRKRSLETDSGAHGGDEGDRRIKRREVEQGVANGGNEAALGNSDDDGEGSVDGEAEDYAHPHAFSHPRASSEIENKEGLPSSSQNVPQPSGQPMHQASPAPPSQALSKEDLRFCTNTLKQIQRLGSARIFLEPVDPVKLNIPTYFDIIKRPMDLSTMEKKLKSNQYSTVQQFADDMDLMIQNCFLFNGETSAIGMMGHSVHKSFQGYMRRRAESQKKAKTDKPKETPKKKAHEIDQLAHDADIRPKREIHAPSKEIPTGDLSRKNSQKKLDTNLKHCAAFMRELGKKQYDTFTWPFKQPVPTSVLGYHDIIKRPMDISTIQRKLNEGKYETASAFRDDMKLMFGNCYTFNPPGTDIHDCGKKFETFFDRKWSEIMARAAAESNGEKSKAKRKADYDSEGGESGDAETDEEGILACHSMMSLQIVEHGTVSADRTKLQELRVKAQLAQAELEMFELQLEQKKKKKHKHRKSLTSDSLLRQQKTPSAIAGKASSSAKKPKGTPKAKATPTASKTTAKKPKKPADKTKKRRVEYSSDEGGGSNAAPLTDSQREELPELIENLSEEKHMEMVNLLKRMGGLQNVAVDGQEEVVLELNELDNRTVLALYRFVKKNAQQPKTPSRKKSAKEGDSLFGDSKNREPSSDFNPSSPDFKPAHPVRVRRAVVSSSDSEDASSKPKAPKRADKTITSPSKRSDGTSRSTVSKKTAETQKKPPTKSLAKPAEPKKTATTPGGTGSAKAASGTGARKAVAGKGLLAQQRKVSDGSSARPAVAPAPKKPMTTMDPLLAAMYENKLSPIEDEETKRRRQEERERMRAEEEQRFRKMQMEMNQRQMDEQERANAINAARAEWQYQREKELVRIAHTSPLHAAMPKNPSANHHIEVEWYNNYEPRLEALLSNPSEREKMRKEREICRAKLTEIIRHRGEMWWKLSGGMEDRGSATPAAAAATGAVATAGVAGGNGSPSETAVGSVKSESGPAAGDPVAAGAHAAVAAGDGGVVAMEIDEEDEEGEIHD
ncbi:hypothetical protein HK104_008947 [Borealophlyctis nickersoniae]|nr:hypothetical protein HK104_008947 [Borealophlyctis nickersoniae]